MIEDFIQPRDLEKLVTKKLKDIGIVEYPFNPYEIIKREKIALVETPFDCEALKGVIMYGTKGAIIAINSNRSYVSRRFAAMHELSHYWFHPRINREVLCLDGYADDYSDEEWQANNAAAYALMPKIIVEKLYRAHNGNTLKMSSALKVCEESLKYRMREIGLPLVNPKNSSFVNFGGIQDISLLENHWLYGGQ